MSARVYMEQRGVYEVVKSWQWTAKMVNDCLAFHYPVWNEAGDVVSHRWKVVRETNKNWWEGIAYPYYLPPGALDAIRSTGTVMFTEGEIDVATLHELGITNSITWFSAKTIPDTFIDDLARWGVERAVLIPDYDIPGLEGALKFADICLAAGLQWEVLKVPGDIGTDLNDAFVAHDYTLTLNTFENWLYQDLQQEIAFLKPIKRRVVSGDGDINPRVTQLLEARALEQGKATTILGKRAIAILDPTGRHAHDTPGEHCYYFPDSVDACDFAYSEWIGGYQLAQLWGIDEPFYSHPTDQPAASNGHGPVPADFIVSDLDVLQQVYGYFRREPVIDPVTIVRTPLPVLWGFRGFCKAMTQGKVLGVAAPSGVGKTIAADTMTDHLTADGYNVLVWSGEWDARETGFRRIQRNGGASMNAVMEDQIARQIFTAKRDASDFVMLTEHTKAQSRQIVNRLEGDIKSGTIGRVYTVNTAYNHYPLPLMLDGMEKAVRDLRAQGVIIHAVILDYMQLVNPDLEYRGPNQAEHSLDLFKRFCIKMAAVGIVTTQVTKGASASAKSGSNLSGHDMQWIREDKFNLLLSLQPVMVGEKQLPYLQLRVQKNSLGAKGYVYLEDTRRTLGFDFSTAVPPKTVRLAIEEEKTRQETLKQQTDDADDMAALGFS